MLSTSLWFDDVCVIQCLMSVLCMPTPKHVLLLLPYRQVPSLPLCEQFPIKFPMSVLCMSTPKHVLLLPPCDQEYDFCRFMSSESEMLRWKAEGLPADNLSMQNGVVILNATLPPLVIDPSTQVGGGCDHVEFKQKCVCCVSAGAIFTSQGDSYVTSVEGDGARAWNLTSLPACPPHCYSK